MTYATTVPGAYHLEGRRRPSRRRLSRTLFGTVAVGAGVLVAASILGVGPVADRTTFPPVTPTRHAALAPSRALPTLLDPGYSLGPAPLRLADSTPLASEFRFAPTAVALATLPPVVVAASGDVPEAPDAPEAASVSEVPAPTPVPVDPLVVAGVPLPTPRPPEFGAAPSPAWTPAPQRRASRRLALRSPPHASDTAAPVDNRGFFERLFGAAQSSSPALGYAAAEDGFFGRSRSLTPSPSQGFDRTTAVYDIAAHTVYMPDGSRLEAHSGLGEKLDDPRQVSVRMRGATPPQVYELKPREALFHGVQALRLTPVGSGNTFGRTGLLAHTFMLGPNGDSNGCVSFRNYNAFLQAYTSGQIRRLAVVAHMI